MSSLVLPNFLVFSVGDLPIVTTLIFDRLSWMLFTFVLLCLLFLAPGEYLQTLLPLTAFAPVHFVLDYL